ncbi:MAG TPA: DJ-1/PfpI family protein [Candidatus Monoglobus merdigallinarum]|uniref:DJ-1/PfpI family protein n=1 Tax=Candidatus Monoglobus merdigallinarum TaxID=2838698 RepID=A0A9D1PQR4_9FIRM|nr:DJ-1/PfpI family protein [Candidatus Monoglobus merdigallinarum]
MLYMFLADGFEETEAIAPLDVIRRAAIDIKTVGIGSDMPCSTHGVYVKPDCLDVDMSDISGIILPGGMPGTLNLQKSPVVSGAIEHCAKENKLIAAICAAPMILGELGLLDGRRATCFPGFEDSLGDAELSDLGVVRDGNFITAAGAGKALEFGAEIVDYILGDDKGRKTLKKMQF